jgi:hypothetical protein
VPFTLLKSFPSTSVLLSLCWFMTPPGSDFFGF